MSEGRRRFLRRTFFGTAALFIAPLLDVRPLSAQDAPGAARHLAFFSDREYSLVSAAAGRITGHTGDAGTGGEPVDAALRADTFLSTEDPEIQDQIHLLLTIFGSPVAALLFNLSFSGFLAMDAESQDDYIRGWMTSSLAFRRTGFQALKRLSMSMHYTDERSWEEIGYHGMELPGGAR